MILHPNVQRKGQAEIDAVVGSSRLPNISDQPNLPYVRAILAETLRIMPPIPLCEHSFSILATCVYSRALRHSSRPE